MKPRPCPFCGEKPEKYRSTWYVCKECELDVPVDVWDYRYDDWRSDGWEKYKHVLVLYRGNVSVGFLFGNDEVYTFGGSEIVPLSECKWKPLPESEGGGA